MRVPIRYKTLMLISAMVLATMGLYLYLATSLFSKDKLASIYDLNAALTETLSEETQLYFSLLADKLSFFSEQVLARAHGGTEREALAGNFLEREQEIVQVELYEQRSEGWAPIVARADGSALDELSITLPDLEETRQNWPIPFAALDSMDLVIRNNSLPPDAPLLTVALALPRSDGEPRRAIVVELKPARLFRILGRSSVYTIYLVDPHGVILVHPNPSTVIEKASFRQRPVVASALEQRVRTGVQEFVAPGGETMLASFSKVDRGGAVVVSEIPKADALRTSRLLIRRSLLFGVALVLAAFVSSVFFARRLTLPILRLRIATQAAIRGDFTTALGRTSRDEIGDLGESFAELFRGLKVAHHQLQHTSRLAAYGWFGRYLLAPVGRALGEMTAHLPIESRTRRSVDLLSRLPAAGRGDETDFERVDLDEAVAEGVDLVRPALEAAGIRVQSEYTAGVPPVQARRADLHQVVMQLALYAHDAMPQGGDFVVRTEVDEAGRAVLVFRDTGAGIAPELHQRSFEPFFSAQHGGGGGMGLAIVYRIVHEHQGILYVDSEPGTGAMFRICLPPA